jgi:CRP/FNR family cyclic AMP-dependent transcriptional regulator
MKLSFFNSVQPDISKLVLAVKAGGRDAPLVRFIKEEMWPVLAQYMHVESLAQGDILTAEGALDCTVYFIESGSLRVHYGDGEGKIHIATIWRGSVVGEGAFFSQMRRNATVQAFTPCQVWRMTPGAFDKLSKEHPTVALAVSMALGAIIAERMRSISQRITAGSESAIQ